MWGMTCKKWTMQNQTTLHLSSFKSLIFRFAFFKSAFFLAMQGGHKRLITIQTFSGRSKNNDIANLASSRHNITILVHVTLGFQYSLL